MKFHCASCGREIRVPETYAGRSGRCPACKVALTVPVRRPKTNDAKAAGAAPASPPGDLTLLDVPEEIKAEGTDIRADLLYEGTDPDAYRRQGTAYERRENTHKMAEANRAFAHFSRRR